MYCDSRYSFGYVHENWPRWRKTGSEVLQKHMVYTWAAEASYNFHGLAASGAQAYGHLDTQPRR